MRNRGKLKWHSTARAGLFKKLLSRPTQYLVCHPFSARDAVDYSILAPYKYVNPGQVRRLKPLQMFK